MNNKLLELFQNSYNCDKISHAFLIGNVSFSKIKDDLEYIFSNYFFDGNINLLNEGDLLIIEPENGVITKEKILDLQKCFKTYSLYNKNRVYIIDGVEKMNLSASNCLLKFLEEPQSNIYGILISQNLNKVIPTIKSRCQNILINNLIDDDFSYLEEETINKYIAKLKEFEKNGFAIISCSNDIFIKKIEKEDLINFIKIVKYFYRECLNYLIYSKINIFNNNKNDIIEVSNNNNINKIINKLLIIIEDEKYLDYNINTNLFFDRFLIRLEKVNNE